jgi:hypothetical protein
MDQLAMNLFDGPPAHADAEIFTAVLSRDDRASSASFRPVNLHRLMSLIVRDMTNEFYSSPVRRACALTARVNAVFAPATMF